MPPKRKKPIKSKNQPTKKKAKKSPKKGSKSKTKMSTMDIEAAVEKFKAKPSDKNLKPLLSGAATLPIIKQKYKELKVFPAASVMSDEEAGLFHVLMENKKTTEDKGEAADSENSEDEDDPEYEPEQDPEAEQADKEESDDDDKMDPIQVIVMKDGKIDEILDITEPPKPADKEETNGNAEDDNNQDN